jgi:hypothetical protein
MASSALRRASCGAIPLLHEILNPVHTAGVAALFLTVLVGAGLHLGNAAIMLQEFSPERQPKGTLGTGASVCFMCQDALALYRGFKSRGIQTRKRPFVGNRLWVVPLTDPDGYRIEFESPTVAPEESELAE